MPEVIVGLGKQKSVRDVANLAEHELRRTQGSPRRLVVRGMGIEVGAERPDYDGDWESYTLKVRVSGEALERLQKTIHELGDCCSISDDGALKVVKCATGNGLTVEKIGEVADKLSSCFGLPEVWRVHGENYRSEHISIELLFQAMIQYKASDVHLAPGEIPMFRIDGQARPAEVMKRNSAVQINNLIRELASEREWDEFIKDKQTSFNFHQKGLGYSRISAFLRGGAPHLTIRFLPEKIPSFDDLNIPADTMRTLAQLHHGLILVTGMTGSGKTTTVAALVDWINMNKSLHILTIENPVEYIYESKKSIMSQRNTGTDVNTFGEAVRGALRHDPDVIVIGEMRDPDTIRSAINAAATGHLVISTLHSNTSAECVNRIVSFFDPVERDLVKLQLRDSLKCIICQRLVPRVGGGRLPAMEIMFNDVKAINDSILTGNTDGIRIGMQQTVSHSFLFETYLHRLYKDGKITLDDARLYSTDSSVLDQMIMGTYTVPRLESIKAPQLAKDA